MARTAPQTGTPHSDEEGRTRTIACFSPMPDRVLQELLNKQLGAGAVRVVAVDEASGAERDKALAETEAALGGYGSFDKTLLEKMPRLKFYQQPSVGFDNVDLAACSARGVLVANLAGVNAVAVAEHTILLALASLKRLIPANAATHAGKWTQRERMSKRDSFELEGKTWEVIGFGTIGREVAKRLAPWGVNLQYFDVRRAAPEQELAAQATYKPLDDLLPLADIVSLHVPLTEQTRGLIGARELDMMKSQAILINVSRGEVADEQAVAERLRANKLGGVGVDVFPHEPISADDPLLALDDAVLTPHIAGVTKETSERTLSWAAANLARFLQGEAPKHVVNPGSPKAT